MSERVYLEFSDGKSNKFWEGEVDGAELTTRWGKIGSDGQTKTKAFDTPAKALAAYEKAVKSKTGKGYAEVSTGAASAPTEAAAPAAKAAPAPAAPAAPLAAPEDTSDTIAWTEEALRMVAPVRGQTHLALPPVSLEIGERIAKLRPIEGQVRAAEAVAGHEALAEHARGAFAWLVGEREEMTEAQAMAAMVTETMFMQDLVIRYAARAFGAARACALLIESLAFSHSTTYDHSQGTQTTLVYSLGDANVIGQSHWKLAQTVSMKIQGVVLARRLMYGLSDDEYAALVVQATDLWGKVPQAHQAALAALFPEETRWAEECFEFVTTGYSDQACTGFILLTPQTDAKIVELLNAGYNGRFVNENYYTLLYEHGPHALDLLAKAASISHTFAAASIVHGLSAAMFWGAAVERDNEHLKRALEALMRFPVLALVGLSRLDAVTARVLSASVAHANPGALEAAIATEGADVARLEQMLPPSPDALAPADRLPPVLADPPWSRKKKKAAKPVTFADLSPPALPTRLLFTDDDRAALEKIYDYQLTQNPKSPQEQDDFKREQIMRYVGEQDTWSYYVARCTPRLMTMNLLENLRAAWDEVPRDFWKVEQDMNTCMEFALARFGEDVLDVVLDLGSRRVQSGVMALQKVESVEAARLMAEGFARVKTAKAAARDWIEARPVYTTLAILPDAFGKDRKRRGYAEKTLMHVARVAPREELLEAARGHYADEVVDALEELLARDPLEVLPRKMPKVPAWLSPQVLPDLVFQEDPGWRLSEQNVADVVQMLTIYDAEDPYPGYEQLREAFTARSLDAFGLAVCQTWLALDGSSKQSWALQSLAEIGGDGVVRALTPKIRKWPGESAVKRAQWGLDVFAQIGTDLALMNIYSISQKIKYKSLKAHASELVERIASERGLTQVELGDRLVPDFDLDARGRLTLDYGPRQFVVGFDESLKPILRNDAGKVIKSLPKPNSKDDEELAKEAKATLRGLKKDLKTIARQQLARLEDALVQQRRWGAEDFVAFLVDHPLMINLTHRLLWGAWEGDALVQSFRVDIDQSFIDVEDEEVDITGYQIGLLHPSQLDAAVSLRWQQVIGDYEIIQPFDQLGRAFFGRAEALEALTGRVIGAKVSAPKLVFGLEKVGWERGPAEDGGAFYYHTRPLASGDQSIILTYEGAVGMGYIEEGEELTIEEIYVAQEYQWRREARAPEQALGALGEITLSEITQGLLKILG
jgi:predicted DNA-binding WGR domain protein